MPGNKSLRVVVTHVAPSVPMDVSKHHTTDARRGHQPHHHRVHTKPLLYGVCDDSESPFSIASSNFTDDDVSTPLTLQPLDNNNNNLDEMHHDGGDGSVFSTHSRTPVLRTPTLIRVPSSSGGTHNNNNSSSSQRNSYGGDEDLSTPLGDLHDGPPTSAELPHFRSNNNNNVSSSARVRKVTFSCPDVAHIDVDDDTYALDDDVDDAQHGRIQHHVAIDGDANDDHKDKVRSRSRSPRVVVPTGAAAHSSHAMEEDECSAPLG